MQVWAVWRRNTVIQHKLITNCELLGLTKYLSCLNSVILVNMALISLILYLTFTKTHRFTGIWFMTDDVRFAIFPSSVSADWGFTLISYGQKHPVNDVTRPQACFVPHRSYPHEGNFYCVPASAVAYRFDFSNCVIHIKQCPINTFAYLWP